MKHSLWKATPAGINGVTENVLSLITMSRKVAAALFILTCFDSIVICKYIPKTKIRTKSEPSLMYKGWLKPEQILHLLIISRGSLCDKG